VEKKLNPDRKNKTIMRRLHTNGFSSADNLIKTLMLLDLQLEPGDSILDFGCGSGSLVYEFLDRGYHACGFDIHNYTSLRQPEDIRFFRFPETQDKSSKTDFLIDDSFRLPCEDASFDFVFSTQVLEHIHNLDAVAREIARVLKPGGIALHVYPRRCALVETHTLIPFNGMFNSASYMRFWAGIGIRNEHQKGISSTETLQRNMDYHKTGLFYRTRREIRDICARHYSQTAFLRNQYYANRPFITPGKVLEFCRILMGKNRLRNMASASKMEVLATFK